MNKTIAIVIGGVLVASAAFGGGYLLAGRTGGASMRAGGPGGAMAQLTDTERQQLATMSDTERQAFFKEKGITLPSGGPAGAPGGQAGGPGGRPGGGGSQLLEGTVTSASAEKISLTLTAGGSANVYVDSSTVVAAVDGKSAEVAQGATVLVYAQPEADGVSAARAVIIK